MASPFAKRIDEILKAGLTPLLRKHRFTKRGSVYLAELGDVAWLVDVQKSRWNDATEAQFTVNGGVYVRGIVSAYCSSPEPRRPRLEDCCLSVRIGRLHEESVDKWWKLTGSSGPQDPGDEQVAAEVCEWVEGLLLAFFRRFESLAEIVAFLEGPIDSTTSFVSPQSSAQRHAYACLVHLRMGNAAKARIEIDEAVRQAEGSPVEEAIKRLREQVLSA